jgi:hypothetical protein
MSYDRRAGYAFSASGLFLHFTRAHYPILVRRLKCTQIDCKLSSLSERQGLISRKPWNMFPLDEKIDLTGSLAACR